jgi:hypothetical protein
MKQVYSSHVDTVHYDEKTKELSVTWQTGKTSVYSGVPADLADKVAKSWSVGSAIRDQIKPYYEHRYAG